MFHLFLHKRIFCAGLACCLLLSFCACQPASPAPSEPPTGWEELLDRFVDLESQTFSTIDDTAWYDSSEKVMQHLNLSEDDVGILVTPHASTLAEADSATILTSQETAFSDLPVSFSRYYYFIFDHLKEAAVLFTDLTAADTAVFLDAFKPLSDQISLPVTKQSSTPEDFFERVKGMPDESDPSLGNRTNLSWCDENGVTFTVSCIVRQDDSGEPYQEILLSVSIDQELIFEKVGYEPPVRTPFS